MYRQDIVKELVCIGEVWLKEDVGGNSRESQIMKNLQKEGLVSEEVQTVFSGVNYYINKYTRVNREK